MSNILKGILNESNPFYGHNDPAREYGAEDPPRFNKSRSSYPSQEDDTFDADVAYSRKMYQLGQQQKAAREKAQRDSDHDRLATGTNEGVRDLGYDAQSLIMKLRRDVEEKRLQPTRQAILAAARELAGDMNFAPELLVQQVLGQRISEGLDDPWGDQGNFAGDKPVNVGGVSMKNRQVGDTVKYLGQSAKIVAMSRDRKYSRITISKGMGTVTQDVLTSDLQQLGQGKAIEENDNTQTRMRMNDYYDLAEALQEKLRQAIKMGNNELIHKLSKERADLDARVKQYGLMPESEQLDEISNEKLSQYKTAAALDAGKADKEGDYKRGDRRFSGIVKATKKQFANDTKKSGISQGINEFSPIKPPTAGAFGGNKDYGQPNSSRYIGGNKFVVGTTNNYVLTATIDKWGLEWDEDDEIWFLDSPGAAHIADASEGEIELPPPREQRNQIHDLVTDYLNARNSADLQKVAAYYGHSDDGEMATNESSEAPRFNSKQEVINHFVKNGKSAAAGAAAWERGYRGPSSKPIELKKPPQRSYHDDLDDKRYSTFENLGDQLKSTSFEELVKAKLAIARQIEAEAEAFKQDLYKNNTVQKAQQGLRREFEPTPVAQPGEKHSVLKDRLKYLDIAKQKFEEVNRLIKAIRNNYQHYAVAKKMDDIDKSLLPYVEVGPKDNYKSLFVKLSKIETELAELYPTAAAAVARKNNQGVTEAHDERDEYDNPRQGRDYGKGNLFVDPGSNEFEKNVPVGVPGGPRGAPKNLKGISKALPADAFGRTTGKIPAGKRGTVHSKMGNTDEVDEDMSRRGFLKGIGAAMAGAAGSAMGQSQRPMAGLPNVDKVDKQKMTITLDGQEYPLIILSPTDLRPRGGQQVHITCAELGQRCLGRYDALLAGGRVFVLPGIKSIERPKEVDEGWSQKYKSSINCSHPKGFSQKAHCAGKKKHNESIDNVMEMTCPDCGMCETHGYNSKDQLDELKCWPGHHRVAGTKAGAPGSCEKNKTNEEGLAEEQLNELDLFAPMTTFIKMTDGSYIQADWRRGQGNPGLSDSASFINFKPVNPNVAKQLGLDSYQRNNSISNHRDGTIAPGGAYQGSGPLSTRGYEVVDYNKPETMEELPPEIKPALIKWVQKQNVVEESCPHCNGPMFSEMIMNEKKDACYYKVKSRYKVWPSAYASGALVKCRNKGASNWGNGGKKNESSILEGINRADESLHDWFNKEKWVRMDTKGKIKGPCAREPGEGKPKCLPQSKAHSLGKKGRASAAQRKRREDPNPERSGKAINVDTKKSKG